jgi:hypothetical protein
VVSDVLIDGLLRLQKVEGVAGGFAVDDRADAIQERGTGADVHRFAPRRLHLTDGHELIAERLDRLHHRLEREVAAGLLRMPRVGVDTAWHVDDAEAERRPRPRLRDERRRHGVEPRKRNGRAKRAPDKCAT